MISCTASGRAGSEFRRAWGDDVKCGTCCGGRRGRFARDGRRWRAARAPGWAIGHARVAAEAASRHDRGRTAPTSPREIMFCVDGARCAARQRRRSATASGGTQTVQLRARRRAGAAARESSACATAPSNWLGDRHLRSGQPRRRRHRAGPAARALEATCFSQLVGSDLRSMPRDDRPGADADRSSKPPPHCWSRPTRRAARAAASMPRELTSPARSRGPRVRASARSGKGSAVAVTRRRGGRRRRRHRPSRPAGSLGAHLARPASGSSPSLVGGDDGRRGPVPGCGGGGGSWRDRPPAAAEAAAGQATASRRSAGSVLDFVMGLA